MATWNGEDYVDESTLLQNERLAENSEIEITNYTDNTDKVTLVDQQSSNESDYDSLVKDFSQLRITNSATNVKNIETDSEPYSEPDSDSEDDKTKARIKFLNYLKEENDQMMEETICKVCLDNKRNRTFLPCKHTVACDECTKKLRACPVCRKRIMALVKVYPVSRRMPHYIYKSIMKEKRQKCFKK